MGALTNLPAGPDPVALAAFNGDSAALGEVKDVESIDVALAQVKAWAVPLKDRDRRFRVIDPDAIAKAIEEGAETRQMVQAVKMIGRKVRPDFSKEQASHWVGAIVASLTDLPPFVAVQACKEALHRAVEFPGQVEKVIREEAAIVGDRYRLARLRLERMRREILDAAKPALVAPDGWKGQERPPPTPDELRRLAGSTLGRAVLEMGRTAGHVSDEDYQAAIPAAATEEDHGYQDESRA